MPLILVLSSSPVENISGETVTILVSQDVIPPIITAVNSMAEALDARHAYAAQCSATGQTSIVYMGKHPRCRARKFHGFDKHSKQLVAGAQASV